MVPLMIRKTLPWLVMLTLAFSGCLGIFDDDLDDEETNNDAGADATGNDGGSEDNGTEPGENGAGTENGDDNETEDPLTASLEANVTSGLAPLAVTFSVNGTVGEDRPLQWSLKAGDDEIGSGESLPETVEYTFEDAGNHTVVLEVSDGMETAEVNVTIEVEELVREPNEIQSGSGSLCLDYIILYEEPGVESPIAEYVDVEPGTDFATASPDGTAWVDFFDEDGASVGYGSGEGTVPDNAAYGIMCVDQVGTYPAAPLPVVGEWTYQDGF